MLFLAEWVIYFIPINIECFPDLHVPAVIAIQPIPSFVFSFSCGFLPPLPIRFKCHDTFSFLPSCGGNLLFLAAGYFFFEAHNAPCLADHNAPAMPTIKSNCHIAAELFP